MQFHKKEVLLVVKNLTSGGAEKQSVLLAKSLNELYNVHYVVLNAKHQEPKYLQLLSESSNVNYTAFNGNLLLRIYRFYTYIKQNKIEYIFSYLTAANLFAVLTARLSGIQHIYPGVRNAYLPPVKSIIERCLCNFFSTKTILNCFSGKRYFEQRGFMNNKMVVIPNCFEHITAYTPKQKKDNIVRIISVGRFVPQKDYDTALRVIHQVSKIYANIQYLVVGYGALEKEIRNQIAELNLESVVKIYINPGNISELLDEADIYLSTSIFEGTSNSIMEAMNANLPVVATNVGDNNELVIHETTGYLTAVKNVPEIIAAVSTLIVDEPKRQWMGKNSKVHLQNNYSVEQFRRKYQQLIETAA